MHPIALCFRIFINLLLGSLGAFDKENSTNRLQKFDECFERAVQDHMWSRTNGPSRKQSSENLILCVVHCNTIEHSINAHKKECAEGFTKRSGMQEAAALNNPPFVDFLFDVFWFPNVNQKPSRNAVKHLYFAFLFFAWINCQSYVARLIYCLVWYVISYGTRKVTRTSKIHLV